ncbi:MAG: DUF4091 domain-containing protein [Lentisphaeria bacterium]|nr:DUF4091 domain-containing protein [Lentisphaeria bacterium]
MKILNRVIGGLCLFSGLFAAQHSLAREVLIEQKSSVNVPYSNSEIVIDGKLDEPLWKNSQNIKMFLLGKCAAQYNRTEEKYPTYVKLAADDNYLYYGIEAVNPNVPGGTAKRFCWENDGMEFAFSTGIFSAGVGAASGSCQAIFVDRFGQTDFHNRNAEKVTINMKDVKVAVSNGEGRWFMEMAIPLSQVPIYPDRSFVALIGRGNAEFDEYAAASQIGDSFHNWSQYAKVILNKSSVAVDMPDIFTADSFKFSKTFTLRNLGKDAIAGDLYVCRSAKIDSKIGTIKLDVGVNKVDFNFTYVNHSIPFYFEIRNGEEVLWRSPEYRYAGNSVKGLFEVLDKLYAKTKVEYFKNLKAELENAQNPAKVLEENKKTLHRFMAVANANKKDFFKKNFFLYTASSMNKEASGKILEEKMPLPQSVSLDAAGDETASFQVRVMPFDKDVKNLTVKEFSIENFDKANLSVHRVLDFEIKGEGIFPDPLSKHLTTDLTVADNSISYFATVKVPRDTKAGIYKGKFVVADSDGSEITVPVTLKVRNFNLPAKPKMFVFMSYMAKPWIKYGQFKNITEDELNHTMRNIIIDYGFMPHTGNSRPEWLDEEKWGLYPEWEAMYDKFNLVFSGSLPWYYGWLKNIYPYVKNRKFDSAEAFVRDKFPFFEKDAEIVKKIKPEASKETYIYYDELETPWQLERVFKMKPDNSELINLLTELKKLTGMKLMTCYCFPNHGDDVPGGEKIVDYFIFNSNYFPGDNVLCDIEGLKSRGKRVGWYWNNDFSPISFNMMNYPNNVGLRLHFYKMYQLGLESTFLWELHYGTGMVYDTKPWTSTRRAPADGILMYREDNQLIPSLRMELLRESYNDGRYLTYAEELAKANPNHEASRKILDMLKLEWSGNARTCNITDKDLLKFKSKLADLMEQLVKVSK